MSVLDYKGLIGNVARDLLGEPNAKLSSARELRFGTHGSLSVDLEKDTWFDHELQEGGGVLDLIVREEGHGARKDAHGWLVQRGYVSPESPRSASPAAFYDYTDEHGEILFQVERRAGHKFLQRRPAAGGGWEYKVRGVRQVPYRLPELLADPDALVFIPEGEKDVDNLRALGLVATCNAGGARKWRATHAAFLQGRDVVILPDNDDEGRAHAEQVRESLEGIAASVRVLELPNLPAKGDVSDWLAAGGTRESLLAMLPEPEPMAPEREELWNPEKVDRFTFEELTNEPPPTQYTVFPYLPKGIAGVLVGAGGTSKTGVMTLLSVHICTGEPLFGGEVEQGKVLFVTAEDRRDVLRKHVWAHARDLPPVLRQRVAENFIPADVVGLGFKLTRSINGQTVVAPDVDGLVEYARSIPNLRLVVLDTLSRLNGGEETNEDLARVVEAMEAVSRATDAATLIAHHTGKAQAREAIADQYSSRGASSLSDNARSVMLVQVVGAKDKDVPTNAEPELIERKGLLRLSHVKANDIEGETKYLRRVRTPHRAQLVPFKAEFSAIDAVGAVWGRVAEWLANQQEVAHPVRRTLEALGAEFGSRQQLRDAVQWALDRGHLVELPHPEPQGARKTYLALPSAHSGGAMEKAA